MDLIIIYFVGERVLCFHGPLHYEANILQVKVENQETKYFIHILDWHEEYNLFTILLCLHFVYIAADVSLNCQIYIFFQPG